MDGSELSGRCVEHADRTATPCSRCGTFRCGQCLGESGLCPECSRRQGAHAPRAEETVGFGRRAGARIIDMVLSQVIGAVGGMVGGMVLAVLGAFGLLHEDWSAQLSKAGFLFNFTSGFAAGVLGAAVGVAISGISPGKAMLGLRVVDAKTGERASIGAGLLREVGYYVDSLFFGLIAKGAMESSTLNQRYGDRWAGTTVVQRASLTTEVAGTTPRVALGLLAFAAVHGSVMAVFVVGMGFSR